jgi:hypothetical protein
MSDDLIHHKAPEDALSPHRAWWEREFERRAQPVTDAMLTALDAHHQRHAISDIAALKDALRTAFVNVAKLPAPQPFIKLLPGPQHHHYLPSYMQWRGLQQSQPYIRAAEECIEQHQANKKSISQTDELMQGIREAIQQSFGITSPSRSG